MSMARSNHPSQVDLVCEKKELQGNKLDQNKVVEKISGLIVYKSKNRKEKKSDEVEGLKKEKKEKRRTDIVEGR